jgi:uncharacterized protein
MKLRSRLIVLLIFLFCLLLVGRVITGNFSFIWTDFWFASGLLLLILMSLIDQPFFSTNANVFMNGVAGLSLILVSPNERDFWWNFFLIWCAWLVISSFFVMWYQTKKKINESKWIDFISKLNRNIGRPEALFSSFFLWGVLRQYQSESQDIDALFLFWAVFMIINLPSVAKVIDSLFDRKENNDATFATVDNVTDPRLLELDITQVITSSLID